MAGDETINMNILNYLIVEDFRLNISQLVHVRNLIHAPGIESKPLHFHSGLFALLFTSHLQLALSGQLGGSWGHVAVSGREKEQFS